MNLAFFPPFMGSMALCILLIHLLGDVPSPPLIGAISDSSSLDQAVLIVPIAIAISGLLWCVEAFLAGRAHHNR